MRHIPEAGAVCGNPARTDLRGGRGVNLRSYRNNGCSHAFPSFSPGWDNGWDNGRFWSHKEERT